MLVSLLPTVHLACSIRLHHTCVLQQRLSGINCSTSAVSVENVAGAAGAACIKWIRPLMQHNVQSWLGSTNQR